MKRLHVIILSVLAMSACRREALVPTSSQPASTSGVSYLVSSGESTQQFVLLGTQQSPGGKQVELYADANPLTEGYHRFRVRVLSGSSVYTGTDVRILPMMYMTNHRHSSPTEQITGAPDANGFYEGAAFFMMPTMSGQPWKMHVAIGTDTVDFVIQVNPHPDGWVRRGRQFGNPNNPRFIYGLELRNRAVGIQDAKFYIYYRDMSLPATDPNAFPGANPHISTVELLTWMPSMSHDGGPGAQPAVASTQRPGHYEGGKVPFNMTGDWWIIATFKDAQNQIVGRDTFALEINTATSLHMPRR